MPTAFLSIGSNLGNRQNYLNSCAEALEASEIHIVTKSPIYETAPVGPVEQDDFLNCVFMVETSLEPTELLHKIKSIETAIGRQKTVHWGPREIDIDIVLYEDKILRSKELTIPHPHMCDREFVLKPLRDIAPEHIHPIEGKTIDDLLERYYDKIGNDSACARISG